MTTRILIVDDDSFNSTTLVDALTRAGREVVQAASVSEAVQASHPGFALALVDHRLPDGTGFDVIDAYRSQQFKTRFVMMTGYASIDCVVEALRRGVDDYLVKPFDFEHLLHTVDRVLALDTLHSLGAKANHCGSGTNAVVRAQSGCRAVEQAYETAARAAVHDKPLLITGETGTGKTRLARRVHQLSSRADGPFIAVNCAAIPENLLESELFGARRGAFTGAVEDRKGLVEHAHEGTLFLDEIGELPRAAQAKLLGIIEERCVRRLGDRVERTVDTRILAATHVNLEHAIQDGTFRSDLFYRINVLRVHLPPLRERTVDLPELVAGMLAELGASVRQLEPGELQRLRAYDWPGNLRELRNVLERASLLQAGELRPSSYLPPRPSARPQSGPRPVGDVIRPLREVEQFHIERAMSIFKGDRQRTAQALGISLSTLKRRLRSA